MDLPLWARIGTAVALAAPLAYLNTRLAISAARHFSFYDRPVGYKGHGRPTPYLGGTAVVLAFALATLVEAGHPRRIVPLIAGALALLVLGTIDDRRHVSPATRVAAELALGALMAGLGLGWHLGAGLAVDALVTALWVVAVVNAFNLFDNMDGAASSMALVAGAGACALAWVSGNVWVAAGSAALCGACVGFLPHNLAQPARIFLGDGGSMPLGFVVAILISSAARAAEPSLLALLTAVLLVGIPLLDTSLVIVSRRRRGIPILTGGRDHLTHRTRLRWRTAQRVVLVLGGAQAVISALVITATRTGSTTLVYLVLGFVVVAVVAIVALDNPRVAAAVAAPGEAELRVGAEPQERRLIQLQGRRRVALALLGVAGLAAGLSPVFSGFYSGSVWMSLGLLVVLAAAVVGVARPRPLPRPAMLALLGLTGLGIWSLVSSGWAHEAEQATVAGNRWLAYAAWLLLLLLLVRTRRNGAWFLLAAGLGIAAVGVSVLIRLAGPHPGTLFIAGRLNSPLGYINGEGCVFAMGCWLSLALAERRSALLAGLGSGLTVMLASLAILSQSRGTVIATAATLLLVLIVVPGRRHRVLTLLPVALAIAAAAHPLLQVYSSGQGGTVPASVAHRAVVTIVVLSLVTAVLWAAGTWVVEAWARSDPAREQRRSRLAAAVVVFATVVLLGAAVVKLPRIEHDVRTQWNAFVHLSDSGSAGSQTRLFTGAGNRYDYWRIAWSVFGSHPVVGVGAGNYAEYYFRARRTQEAIQNPHSIELQILSELGVVGGVLLAILIGGVAVGTARIRRLGSQDELIRSVAVAGLGTFCVWFVDASGDWMHLLPGVTAIALAGVAVLCAGDGPRATATSEDTRAGFLARPTTLAAMAAGTLLLAVSGASLMRSRLAQYYLSAAQAELRLQPGSAVRDADRALRLDGANLDAYYVKAAGQARFNLAAGARSTLLAAAREDPEHFVTWVLLGDLETRLRDYPAARAFYRRAHALDPNDPAVAALAGI